MHTGGAVSVAVRELTKTFAGRSRGRRHVGEDVVALDAVTLDIGAGEFFSLLGPSGCGKTTMLRLVAGLDYPTAGSIEIFGESVAAVPPHKRPVNTVFQQYALFPHMTVTENVAFGLRMQKVPAEERRQRVGEALELVRMSGLERRRPDELSGGQQQRVALARALVNRPRVLLLDEPLGALDQKLRVEMQHELHGLQRELGITFVFVTHDQEEALTMSDRIAVLHDGRVLQVGTATEVYEHPVDRFVADFIGEITAIDAVVADASSVALPTGDRVTADVADRTVGSAVTVALRPERLRLAPVEADEPTTSGGRLIGRVGEATYLGHATTLAVHVEWIPMLVRLPVGAEVPAPGDEVAVSWDASALLVLDGETDTTSA